jgi:uncharacterized membrane-anchored protein YitT (DUF2179 family)
MRKTIGVLVALVLVCVGGAWASRGLGLVGEALPERDAVWYAIVGPMLLGFGLALGYVVLRGPGSRGT